MKRRELLRIAIQIAFGARLASAIIDRPDYGYGPCGVCGDPATNTCVDMVETGSDSEWECWEPIMKSRRARCQRHKTPSRAFYRMVG